MLLHISSISGAARYAAADMEEADMELWSCTNGCRYGAALTAALTAARAAARYAAPYMQPDAYMHMLICSYACMHMLICIIYAYMMHICIYAYMHDALYACLCMLHACLCMLYALCLPPYRSSIGRDMLLEQQQ